MSTLKTMSSVVVSLAISLGIALAITFWLAMLMYFFKDVKLDPDTYSMMIGSGWLGALAARHWN